MKKTLITISEEAEFGQSVRSRSMNWLNCAGIFVTGQLVTFCSNSAIYKYFVTIAAIDTLNAHLILREMVFMITTIYDNKVKYILFWVCWFIASR
jgi:hypothetical protein